MVGTVDEAIEEAVVFGGVAPTAGFSGTAYPVLPMPAFLEPKISSRTLMFAVKGYFYQAYKNDPKFVRHLASVSNPDSVTMNRMFDRHVATEIIRELAVKANDEMTANAPAGRIYKCLVHIMKSENLGLKLRREQYRQLTHYQQAAE